MLLAVLTLDLSLFVEKTPFPPPFFSFNIMMNEPTDSDEVQVVYVDEP